MPEWIRPEDTFMKAEGSLIKVHPYVYTILGRLRWISIESVIRETLEAYSFFKCKLINTVPESGLGNCLIIKWAFSSRQNLILN